ncbi:unnamed protein product [Acanthoscelides obtectus]|nr:unnamed protein product [Acanthoscelides obtectus]CAK1624759.1 Protein ALP1-like [Acanthoscelides obtectus]
MANNTVAGIVHETCRAIWESLGEIHMKFPLNEEAIQITDNFWKRWKFPNCIGCIDRKHIRIKAPANSGSMFYNYKHFFSIVLQGIAGPDYRFIAIEVGAYGKESDGGIFSNSRLSKRLENGSLNATSERQLPGTNVFLSHALIADEAYPLKTYLRRPYPERSLGPEEEYYNRRLSLARQVVECAFGIMTSKWRLLTKRIKVHLQKADIIIQCICLLHNIVIDREGIPLNIEPTPNGFQQNAAIRARNRGENHAVRRAYAIREQFKSFFQ